jgi:hypothetical protein
MTKPKPSKAPPLKSLQAYGQASRLEEPEAATQLLDVYDRMRKAAALHEGSVVVELTRLLEMSLDYEANPVFALRLQKLYAIIRECVELGAFEQASHIADELHAMWQQALAADRTSPAAVPDDQANRDANEANPSASS